MTILITRPAHQAQSLSEKIKNIGYNVIMCPMLEIIGIKKLSALKKIMNRLSTYDIAIFISSNAVENIPSLQSYLWPTHVETIAMGTGTASTLSKYGIPVNFYPKQIFNSESLLALPILQAVKNKKIILFRGAGGKKTIARVLKMRGAILTELITYRRTLPSYGSLSFADTIDIIICTSCTSLKNLLTLYPASINMQLLVVSQRIADFARTLRFVKMPLIADNASDQAILETLITWRGTKS